MRMENSYIIQHRSSYPSQRVGTSAAKDVDPPQQGAKKKKNTTIKVPVLFHI